MYLKASRPPLRNCKQQLKFEKASESIALLRSLVEGDVLLSLSAPSRIAVEVVDPSVAKVNIHCGKLPEFAGMMPIFWQILAGRETVTVVLHELSKEIDTGRVISETSIPLSKTLFETSVAAKRRSAEIFFDFLLSGSDVRAVDKKDDNGTKSAIALSKFPTAKDVRRFSTLMRRV